MSAEPIFSPRYEQMSRDELRQLQLERLQATLNRAYKHVPFYRKRLEEAGLQPEDFQQLDDLRALPFTTKEDLRAAYPYEMLAVPLREVVRFHLSAATTGTPVVIAYSANDLARWTDLAARTLTAAGITREDVVQIFFGYGLFSAGFGLQQGAEALGASVLPVPSSEIPQQVQLMQDFRTTALIGNPSYALALAETIEEEGLDMHLFHLRVGLFGAEPWSERTRREIEERLQLEAFDSYGISELGGPGLASECSKHCGLHVAEDHFLVEVIDPATGEVLPEGETGELVFTSLTREALPLLRYRSGDLSSYTTAPCECGRTTMRLSRVLKRVDDMVIIHGVRVRPDDLAPIFSRVPEVSDTFQLVLERHGGHDELTVRVALVAIPADLRALHTRLQAELEQKLGFEVKLSFAEPAALEADLKAKGRVADNREERN